MSNKLEDLGKSMDLAQVIEFIKGLIPMIDMEHLQTAIKTFRDQSSFEHSAAVLNRRYNPKKPDLLLVQAETMQHLFDFIEGLKECQRLKDEIKVDDANYAKIEKLFW